MGADFNTLLACHLTELGKDGKLDLYWILSSVR
jgi:hypothetical protein